ncbi:MAG: kumamolisin [Mycobacterium sp.]|nr:kumamolisin [Mycobacterium sp.]
MDSHSEGARGRPGGVQRRILVLAATATLVLASCARAGDPPTHNAGAGPKPSAGSSSTQMLDGSTDLGPAQGHPVDVTVSLNGTTRPEALIAWADSHHLSVDWSPGHSWAYLMGSPADVGSAFGVSIHDYRSADGKTYYEAKQAPEIPAPVRGDVSEVGRIVSGPVNTARPPVIPRDVPDGALSPTGLMKTYNAAPLKADGKGQTIVFFEIDSGNQSDYDKFTQEFNIPVPLKPTEIGNRPKEGGETPMDVEVVHGMAPAAQKVILYLPVAANGNLTTKEWADSMAQIDRDYPGAVWSISLIWICDLRVNAANLAPIQEAIRTAEQHGTSVFMSSGDNGGYECKGQQGHSEYFAPPVEGDIGLNAVASIPEVVSAGGTTLSTDSNGGWVTEAGWADYPSGFGTGGGVSNVYARPDWQRTVQLAQNLTGDHQGVPDPQTQRLTPDFSAVADGATGAGFYKDGKLIPGGGTSLSAPILAALTMLMNQYLTGHGGKKIGDINPVLYKAATGSRPAFHDVTFGGNVAYNSGEGFDLATGLGTPDTFNLVQNILDIQKAGG